MCFSFLLGEKMLFIFNSAFKPLNYKFTKKKLYKSVHFILQKARNRAIDSKHAHIMKYPSHLVSYAKSLRKIS